ncbi:capsular polysaccharide biosynthesis protein [Planomicrobium soli]|uniref:Capsular polysaccharide biosynthesis protein n=1 Tax=Planomicrobium soli TaxID=1176648 RepID=A0A2P8GCG8_9BACL|nr:Wzz/FepE/Etk N-terminal domain-containing protein [Planomicrobium soli]PSL31684.1 capsular polysaccharide biosynthesis protein [Planomicrobium soli]
MESTFNIKEFFKNMKKRLPIILIMTFLITALFGIASYTLLKPIYQASTQLLVNQTVKSGEEGTALSIDDNLQLISTYNVIIKSPVILNAVIEELKLADTVATLDEKITVSSTENSQVVQIAVEDESMSQAVAISNTVASVFQAEIKSLMNVDNVKVLAPAVESANPSPVKPDPFLNMAIGAILGFMLGTGIAILLDQMNTTVRTEEDIEEIIGLQVLGIVSSAKTEKEFKKSGVIYDQKEMVENVENEKLKTISNPKIGGSY